MKFILHVGLFLSAGADLASTQVGIHRGAVELNPIAGQHASQQAAVAFGSATAMYLISKKLEKDHPKLAGGLDGGFIAARIGATIHNARVH